MSLFSLDRVLGLTGVGTTIINIAILKRFIAGVTLVIALTAISSTMIGALIIAAFYGLYISLLYYGMSHQAAVFSVIGLAIAIMIALAVWAKIKWRELGDLPHLLFPERPIHHVTKLAEAFVDGLLERHH